MFNEDDFDSRGNPSRISISKLIAEHDSIFSQNKSCLFCDWVANDDSLKSRATKMIPKLKFLVKEGLINGDTHYVTFENYDNGALASFDEVRIHRKEDGFLMGGFRPQYSRTSESGNSSIWSVLDPDTERSYESWTSLKNDLKTNKELRSFISRTFNQD